MINHTALSLNNIEFNRSDYNITLLKDQSITITNHTMEEKKCEFNDDDNIKQFVCFKYIIYNMITNNICLNKRMDSSFGINQFRVWFCRPITTDIYSYR